MTTSMKPTIDYQSDEPKPLPLKPEPDKSECIFCGLPFGRQLRKLDPLQQVVPHNGNHRIATSLGDIHSSCVELIMEA